MLIIQREVHQYLEDIELVYITHLSMTNIPPPSCPSVFSTGTFTLSKVMYAVPAVAEYDVLMGLVSTPSPRSTRMTVKPSYTN